MQVLIVPGLGDSGPGHWQTLWEREHPEYRRVRQRDWNAPDLDAWAESVDRAIRDSTVPCVLVGHSFGCLAIARCAAASCDNVLGAMLVAPAAPQRFGLRGLVQIELDFPSTLVASEDDPWLSLSDASTLAARWGSRLVNLGPAGHINVASGHGSWPRGKQLLLELIGMVERNAAADAV